jgi:general secretion pathway protein A
MYESFFGLRDRPFDITPNPRFLFFAEKHRQALVDLQFGVASRKGVVVLVGEAGTGKTTVARALMQRQRSAKVEYVYLNNPVLTRAEFVQFLARALRLSKPAEKSKTDLMAELATRLMAVREQGRTVALIVDEAQSLSDEMLEEIRLLTNIETNDEKLLTLILVGQPKLADRLNDDAWKQLKQRVELRCTLTPFDVSETAAYIWSRIRIAGGDGARLFTIEAVRLVHERSRGIPRSINVICENALISGFAEHEQPVTRRLVLEVCEEFELYEQLQTAAIENSTNVLHRRESDEGPNEVRGAELAPSSVGVEEPAAKDIPPAAAAQSGRRWRLFSKAGTRP